MLDRRWLKVVSPAPGTQSRKPSRDVCAIFFVIGTKHFLESWFLVELHKQYHRRDRHNQRHESASVRPAKHDPQADPTRKETDVHRVSYVPVKSHHHQTLRWNERRGRAMAGAPEIPDAPQSHGETQHRRQRANPPPRRLVNRGDVKTHQTGQ